MNKNLLKGALFGAMALVSPALHAGDDKTVIVTLENLSPADGAFLTPVWVGLHDGSFDIYDRDAPASGGLERLAEDGNTGPLSEMFSHSDEEGMQATIASNGAIPPLAPGEKVSHAFQVDSDDQRYFSYASMVIPSNDAFIANGDPKAHPLFDDKDRFIGRSFLVKGSAVLDAGTEVNDEEPANTAFLGQAAPDTGDVEGGVVTSHPGFQAGGNILSAFPGADFTAEGSYLLRVTLRCVEQNRTSEARGILDPVQEVSVQPVDSDGTGTARIRFKTGSDNIRYWITIRRLSSDVVGAHFHLGSCNENGPVIVNITDEVSSRKGTVRINGRIEAEDVIGPLASGDQSLMALIGEMMSGNTYINIHTEKYPAGEVRAQVRPQFRNSASKRGED
ncbi:MAG: spondin domain-containing protein [Verrucomicrobiota bacterium]